MLGEGKTLAYKDISAACVDGGEVQAKFAKDIYYDSFISTLLMLRIFTSSLASMCPKRPSPFPRGCNEEDLKKACIYLHLFRSSSNITDIPYLSLHI